MDVASEPQPSSAPIIDKEGMVKLAWSAAPAKDEEAIIRIKAGPFPRGAHLTAETTDGKPIAMIRPFGGNDPNGTNYTFEVPRELLKDLKLTIKLTVHEIGGKTNRPPTTKEVMQITTSTYKQPPP